MKTKDWFRPPAWHEMCRTGDIRRFLLIAEPEMGKGCYGVGFAIDAVIVERFGDPDLLDRIKQAAARELEVRIERGDAQPEGSLFEVFLWNPRIVRDDDDQIQIRS